MNKSIALILVLLVLVSGCASSARSLTSSEMAGAPAAADVAYEEGADSDWGARPDSNQAGIERIVIRNANLSIVVLDPGQAMDTIGRMAEEMGGFVVQSNLYKTFTRNDLEVPEANITVRVPAEKLTTALDQIKALVEDPSSDILSENVSGQDVTQEYTDLNSQLGNLEQAEAQLREIMASASKTEDVLAIHRQLTEVRERIEVLKGQIRYYDEAAALSAIEVRIQAKAAVQPLQIGGWQPVGDARNAVQALINTLQFLGSAAIWLIIYILPVGLIIFFPVRLLWRLFRRATRRQPKPVEPTPPQPVEPGDGSP